MASRRASHSSAGRNRCSGSANAAAACDRNSIIWAASGFKAAAARIASRASVRRSKRPDNRNAIAWTAYTFTSSRRRPRSARSTRRVCSRSQSACRWSHIAQPATVTTAPSVSGTNRFSHRAPCSIRRSVRTLRPDRTRARSARKSAAAGYRSPPRGSASFRINSINSNRCCESEARTHSGGTSGNRSGGRPVRASYRTRPSAKRSADTVPGPSGGT